MLKCQLKYRQNIDQILTKYQPNINQMLAKCWQNNGQVWWLCLQRTRTQISLNIAVICLFQDLKYWHLFVPRSEHCWNIVICLFQDLSIAETKILTFTSQVRLFPLQMANGPWQRWEIEGFVFFLQNFTVCTSLLSQAKPQIVPSAGVKTTGKIIIIPSQMEVGPLHCTVDIAQKRRLFKNTKEIEKM